MPVEVINSILGALAVVLGWWLRHQFGAQAAPSAPAAPADSGVQIQNTQAPSLMGQVEDALLSAARNAIVNSHINTAAQAVGKIQAK